MHNSDVAPLSRTSRSRLSAAPGWHLFAALLSAMLLTACGGGGGGGGGSGDSSRTLTDSSGAPALPFDASPPVAVPDNSFGVDCSGSRCGAIDNTTYAGSGVGLWRYSNTTASPAAVPVAISGTFGREVTLILTNLGDVSSPLANTFSPSRFANINGLNQKRVNAAPDNSPGVNRIPARIRHFQTPPLAQQRSAARSLAAPSALAASGVGDSRNWYDPDDQPRTATLQIARTAIDGRRVNFWLESSEYDANKVTDAQLQALADAFTSGDNAIYNMVTSLAGQPWGGHSYGNLIDSTQPLDIVLLNMQDDSQAWGLVGFFWGRNNFRNGTQDGNNVINTSNESLSLYLDTETLYLDSDGLRFEISTLAHELVHMINFYQRSVRRSPQSGDYRYDSWLEELTASMMEDLIGTRLDPSYHIIRDDRFPSWLQAGDFNCDLTTFDDDTGSRCFGYNLAGSFGAWLLRHYGIDFYLSLLTDTSSTDSVAVLDHALRQYGGLGFKDAVRRWGTLLAPLPAAAPDWFGLPGRTQRGFTLPAIDGRNYLRQLPTSAPAQLVPNGHFPQRRANVADPYVETVTVPAHTTLTVIVQ